VYPGLPKVFGYSLSSQEWVKLRTSNFARTFTESIATKGCSQGLRKILRAPVYRAHHKKRSNTCYSAPLQASPTSEALRYMARTKHRRTYLPYTFPAVAGTHLPTPKGWRVE